MIDFVKAVVVGPSKQDLIDNPLLNFKGNYEVSSGETNGKLIAEYKNMKFIIYNDSFIMMQGSLHKYKNDGKHNYDSFYHSELVVVLNDLQKKFGIDLSNCIVQNVEVGVNIKPPIESNQILNNLLLHKQTKFKDVSIQNGVYKQVVHQRYYVKAYNKKMQYKKAIDSDEEIFRFELKFMKSIAFNNLGLKYLIDLLNEDVLKRLGNCLEQEWINCLLYDVTIDNQSLSKRNREVKLNQWRNWSFWVELSKQARFKQLRQYKEICRIYSKQLKEQLLTLIEIKIDYSITN